MRVRIGMTWRHWSEGMNSERSAQMFIRALFMGLKREEDKT